MKSNQELIDKFLDSLSLNNYSNNTITNYRKDLQLLLEFMHELEIDNFSKFSRISVQNFQSYIGAKDFSKTSKNRKLSCIRRFFNYLEVEGFIKENLFSNIKSAKVGKRIPNFASSKEMNSLFKSVDSKTTKGSRDLAIVEVLYGTGIRVSELTAIKLNDVNFYNETILIRGKGNKERIVPMHSEVIRSLKNYLFHRNEFLIKSKNFEIEELFLNLKGTKLTSRGVRLIIDNIVENASIVTKITPHTFRHSFATDLINNGADIRSVQELLGHENLSSTEIYTHVSIEKIKNSYLDAFPRKRSKK